MTPPSTSKVDERWKFLTSVGGSRTRTTLVSTLGDDKQVRHFGPKIQIFGGHIWDFVEVTTTRKVACGHPLKIQINFR